MKTVGASEAKTHLARLLEEAAAEETITITKHGRPVARLTPPPNNGPRPDIGNVIAEIREFQRRENIDLGGLLLRELIDEGRRY